MHQRKGKKILTYFFVLLLVGSINNIELKNIDISEIKNIKVSGLEEVDNKIIFNDIKKLSLGNILFLDSIGLTNLINSNALVEEYEIFKKYPSSLNIELKKTEFLAKINKNEKIQIIGSNGKLSENKLLKNDLPFIFGNPNVKEFLTFKKILDDSNFSYSEIQNFYFFPSKRWDLQLKNGIIIKLSQKNIKESLNYAFLFLNNIDLTNLKIIDARIQKKIILND